MRYETNLLTGEVTEHPDDPVTPEAPLTSEQISNLRRIAYQNEADPVFFKEQRGEVTQGTWIALVNEIKARYPQVF